LHHIVNNSLFAIVFCYFYCLAYFWPANRRVESKRPETFQDMDFEYL
jgi:hypothetical protein